MKKFFAFLVVLVLVPLFCSAFAESSIDVVYHYYADSWSVSHEGDAWSGFYAELLHEVDEIDDALTIATEDGVEDFTPLINQMMTPGGTDVDLLVPVQGAMPLPDGLFGSRPCLAQAPVVVTKADSGIVSIADLAACNVAIYPDFLAEQVDGYNAAHPGQELAFGTAYTSPNGFYDDYIGKLGSGYDAVLLPLTAVSEYLIGENADQYTLIEIPDAKALWTWEYFMVYPRETDALRAQIESDIDTLVANGAYTELCMKYFGVDLAAYIDSGAAPTAASPEGAEAVEAAQPDEAAEAAEAAPVVYDDRDTVRKVQQALNDAGFPCGTPDGMAGKKTKAALEAYQAEHGLEVTGEIDGALLEAMGLATPGQTGAEPEAEAGETVAEPEAEASEADAEPEAETSEASAEPAAQVSGAADMAALGVPELPEEVSAVIGNIPETVDGFEDAFDIQRRLAQRDEIQPLSVLEALWADGTATFPDAGIDWTGWTGRVSAWLHEEGSADAKIELELSAVDGQVTAALKDVMPEDTLWAELRLSSPDNHFVLEAEKHVDMSDGAPLDDIRLRVDFTTASGEAWYHWYRNYRFKHSDVWDNYDSVQYRVAKDGGESKWTAYYDEHGRIESCEYSE